MNNKKSGFTIVELLVVISIIGMLSSVILVALQGARDKGVVAAGLQFATYNYHYVGAYTMLQLNFNGNINDSSPNSYIVGAYQNATPVTLGSVAAPSYQTDTPGTSGQSMLFYSASPLINNAHLEVAVSPSVPVNTTNGLQDHTVSVWLKPTDLGTNQIVLYSDGCGAAHRCINIQIITSSGVPSIFMGPNDNGFGNDIILSSSILTLNKWQNLTYTYTPSHVYKVYVNGKLVNMGANTGTPQEFDGSITKMTIGGDDQGANAAFRGMLDDVSVYKQALSDSQVEQIYALGATKHDLALK